MVKASNKFACLFFYLLAHQWFSECHDYHWLVCRSHSIVLYNWEIYFEIFRIFDKLTAMKIEWT